MFPFPTRKKTSQASASQATLKEDDARDEETIPLSAFEEMVAQYHHRLLSLEADLKDAGRRGELSPKAFAKRVARLQDVHRELKAVERLCVAETNNATKADVGLPSLTDCTPAEKAVCERYLDAKEIFLKEATEDAARVLEWLQDTTDGGRGTLKTTMRLSKLRKLIQKMERRMELMREQSKGLGMHVDKLLRALNRKKESGQSTIQGLVILFEQLNGTISRVARLKAAVKKHEGEAARLATWLEQQEAQLKAHRPALEPPSPIATARAARAAEDAVLREYHKSRRRRTLVEDFWRTVVHGEGNV